MKVWVGEWVEEREGWEEEVEVKEWAEKAKGERRGREFRKERGEKVL